MNEYFFECFTVDFASGKMDNAVIRSKMVADVLNEHCNLVDGVIEHIQFSDSSFSNRQLFIIISIRREKKVQAQSAPKAEKVAEVGTKV